jgi:CRISPR-associated endonuclease/helicase Cas3
VNSPRFAQFFSDATSHEPFDYQRRLAGRDTGTDCQSQLINIPTGLGKTAAVVLAWLWNRVQLQNPKWPRRLVYCLPMRTLVEQTKGEVEKWLMAHELVWDGKPENRSGKIGVHVLMGGEEAAEWDIYPEENAILIGTQDMLLSRALNRGYGMSRYRWPMHFGLLNNDCLWVMDETQLMGPALWTSAQLDWMRHDRFRSLFPAPTWWMSATVGDEFLKTSDRMESNFPMPQSFELGNEPNAARKLAASRPCAMWTEPASPKKKAPAKGKAAVTNLGGGFAHSLAAAVIDSHVDGTLSLVICNTVATAQSVFAEAKKSLPARMQLVLLTSRFRKGDREKHVEVLLNFEKARKDGKAPDGPGLICVSTQVVEAGVDVSATRLWSEVAPWPSLVQRMGRLNRDGGSNANAQALFFWDSSAGAKQKKGTRVGPYEDDAVTRGEKILTALIELSANEPTLSAREALAQIRQHSAIGKEITAALQPVPEPYPRASEVHGLFSTEPDLFGGFTDVSPFVRDSDDDADVTVFWRSDAPKRAFPGNQLEGPAFAPQEGVRVSIGALRKLLEKGGRAYHWNDDKDEWVSPSAASLCPGMVLMLRGSTGGYDAGIGWTGDAKHRLENLPPPGPFAEDFDRNRKTFTGEWQELHLHLAEVKSAATDIAARLKLPENLALALITAAAYHDIGKTLPKWQSALPQPPPEIEKLWAKSRFLLAIRPSSKDFRPELVDQFLAEAGIKAVRATPPARYAPDSVHCWQICSYVKNTEQRRLKDELEKLPGVEKAWHVSFRPALRHEAGSALALWWRYFRLGAEFPGITIYLAAAHHGKVRTVLYSRGEEGTDVCGIVPTDKPLNWESGMLMDFACAGDGSSGTFSEDGMTFTQDTPGWTALIADLIGTPGGANKEGSTDDLLCLSSRESEASHLGPFALAYLEALMVAADVRPELQSATTSEKPATR